MLSEYLMESEEPLAEALKIKLEKVKALRKSGKKIYKTRFDINSGISDIKTKYSALKAGEKSEEVFKIAGRLMSFRKHGKVTFSDLKDFTDKIQLYINQKNIGEEKYDEFLDLDIGDWAGVEGTVFVTHAGELSINVSRFELLSKALRVLPEKWHGLKDKELRYHQRYLDFIVNPEVKDVFLTRIKIINALRKFLNDNGFKEVETPMLQYIPGGATAKPFKTHHNALDMDLYLRIAPELYLKRLLIGGFDKVFEICRSFRNEGIDRDHNPEFTMFELYWAYQDWEGLMKFTQKLLKKFIPGKWQKITYADAVKKYARKDLNKLKLEEI